MIDDTRIKRCAMLGEPIPSLLAKGASHARSKNQTNKKQAAYYFSPAARRGCIEAQFSLGFLYEKGIGIWKNKCLAYMWYYLAATKGHNQAKIRCERLEKNMLAPSQIVEAKLRAKKHSKPCCEFCKKGERA